MKILANLVQQQRWGEAEARLRVMRRANPANPDLLFTLGYVLHATGRLAEAADAFRHCLELRPAFVPAMINLGTVLLALQTPIEAVRFAQSAIKHQPDGADAHLLLARAWGAARNSQFALEAVDHALRLTPDSEPALALRMSLLKVQGRKDEAVAVAHRILGLPGHELHGNALTTLLGSLADQSHWQALDALTSRFARAMAMPSSDIRPATGMMAFDDPALLLRMGANQPRETRPPRPPRRPPGGRITIGYLSADFREHPVAHMLAEILPHHDRQRFRVLLLSLTPPDTTAVADRLRTLADGTLDLTQCDDPQAAALIAEAGVDVLVDLTGDTGGGRPAILAARPSRAQVLWLGCPVTTGRRDHDAFVVDGQVAPPGYERFCSEPLVRLPCCYHPIGLGHVDGTSHLTRRDLGLPDDALLVAMLQTTNRVRPPLIADVARTIAAHPRAHLVLRLKEASHVQAFAQLAAWGLPTERVHVLPRVPDRAAYLRALQLMDLLVDSHPYGGHSTSGEALTLGLPLLTRYGDSIHSRVAASMMHDLGLGDLVARSAAQQLADLDRLLGDPALLATWRARFTAAAVPPAVPRQATLTRALEAAFVQVLDADAPAS